MVFRQMSFIFSKPAPVGDRAFTHRFMLARRSGRLIPHPGMSNVSTKKNMSESGLSTVPDRILS